MDISLGIDFGTCFSSAAVVRDGIPVPIRLGANLSSLPSSVFVNRDGDVLVGAAADRSAALDPGSYRGQFKRDLGSGNVCRLGTKQFRPEQLVAEVLRELRVKTEFLHGTSIRSAVLTVPAHYQDHLRELMRDAAEQAGFDREQIALLDEPEAAASYFTWRNHGARPSGNQETVLVYDLGGGTFDVALIRREGDTYHRLALPAGNDNLGGIDFEREIYVDVLNRCPKLGGRLASGANGTPEQLCERLQVGDVCRELKHHLSEDQEARETFPQSGEEYRITRAAFEAMLAPYLDDTLKLCRGVLREASLPVEKVDRVLLVGGSTRIPAVARMLERELRRPVVPLDEPELAVCLGASLHRSRERPPPPSPPAPLLGPLREYRRAVGMAWADGTLNQAELEQLNALARELGLTPEQAGGVEREELGIPPPEAHQPPTMWVSPRGRCRSIAVALRLVPPGGVVQVGPGEYSDDLVIDRAVTIVGNGPASEILVSTGGIALQAERATLKGITIRGIGGNESRLDQVISVSRGRLEIVECDVSGDARACIRVEGASTWAIIRNCRIHDGPGVGILFDQGCEGRVEDSEVFGTSLPGVDVARNARASLRRCRIHGGGEHGVYFHERGEGEVVGCEVSKNRFSGITLESGAAPKIRECTIFGNQHHGVSITAAAGTLERCDIYDHPHPGIVVAEGAAPVIRGCKVSDAKASGILLVGSGAAVIEETEVCGNTLSGITTSEGSAPAIRRCKLHGNNQAGLLVHGGRGTVEDCEILANREAGVEIRNGGTPALLRCRITESQGPGIRVHQQGRGSVAFCDLQGNRGGAWALAPGCTVERVENVVDGGRIERLRNQALLDGAILAILKQSGLGPRLYLPPIPYDKLARAREKMRVPADEGVLGLLDNSLFGAARYGVVFGQTAIYSRNVGGGFTSLIPYAQLENCSFVQKDYVTITAGNGVCISASGSSYRTEVLVKTLNEIKLAVHHLG